MEDIEANVLRALANLEAEDELELRMGRSNSRDVVLEGWLEDQRRTRLCCSRVLVVKLTVCIV